MKSSVTDTMEKNKQSTDPQRQMIVEEHKQYMISQTRKLINGADAAVGEAVVPAKKEPPRQSNRLIVEALDASFLESFLWGLNVFDVPHPWPLPKNATRYTVRQLDPLIDRMRNRAAVELEDGTRRPEVPFKTLNGKHDRPTLHLHNDMCGGSWYAGMCIACDKRATTGWDRMHRLICDKDDATAEAGLTIVRLEAISAAQVRRKPWGKNGNHRIMKDHAQEFYSIYEWDCDLHQLWYPDIAEGLGMLDDSFGTDEHMKLVWEVGRKKILARTIQTEANNSRWWIVETSIKEHKPVRGLEAMILMYIGQTRK